jgi:hypothetical protein
MFIERERFLLLATALASCHESQPAQRSADASFCAVDASAAVPSRRDDPAASAGPADPSSALPSPPLDVASVKACPLTMARSAAQMAPVRSLSFCEEISRNNDRLLSAPDGYCEGYASAVEATRSEVARQRSQPEWHYCHQGKGAWAIRLLTVTLDAPGGEAGGCGWGATYEFVHEGTPDAPPGERATSLPQVFSSYPDDRSELKAELTFDYDGDGQDELIVGSSEWQNGGGTDDSVVVLRAAGQKVVPYEVGFAFNGVADVDGDGRPDLLQGDFFRTGVCALGSRYEAGPPLLVHSLPNGKFSASDDTARRWAATTCPKTSKQGGCAWRAGCMVVWGRPQTEIAQWMRESQACSEAMACGGGSTDVGKGELPFRPLNVDTPQPLPPSKMLIEPPSRGSG